MFSLKSLLVGVAIAGLGTAGLINRTQLWASAFVGITLGLLLYATFRAWLVPRFRAFWGPFAVTGAFYFGIVSLQPLVDLHYNLPTTQLVVYGLEKMQTSQPPPARPVYGYGGVPGPAYGSSAYGNAPQPAAVQYDRGMLFRIAMSFGASDDFPTEARAFLWVAQCLWCLLLAAVAGVTCSWLVRRSETSVNSSPGADAG